MRREVGSRPTRRRSRPLGSLRSPERRLSAQSVMPTKQPRDSARKQRSSSPGGVRPLRYHNTDLDLVGRQDLDKLVVALEATKRVFCLDGSRRRERGLDYATFEL